jgi:hypothetical protein
VSHIYNDSIDSGMCDHVSSFLCNLGVECELVIMKGVLLHSHWHQFTLVRLKNKTTKLLVCALMFWDHHPDQILGNSSEYPWQL